MIEDYGSDEAVLSTDEEPNSDIASNPSDPRISVTKLAVESMAFSACTSAVESELKYATGVISVDISLLSERVVVEHDADITTPEQVADIIKGLGFGARVLDTCLAGSRKSSTSADSGEKTCLLLTTVAIGGMTCGACASSVQRALSNADGVIQFNISILAQRGLVVHDPTILPVSKIPDLIQDAGFGSSVLSSEVRRPLSKKTQQINLSLYGLRDSTSATALAESLLQQQGMHSASIKMSTSRIVIFFDSSIISIQSVVEVIEAAGYNVLMIDSDDASAFSCFVFFLEQYLHT